jgi:O-antigen ligase
MSVLGAESISDTAQVQSRFPAMLFVGIFLFAFISFAPFADLGREEGRSLALDQLAILFFATSAMICVAKAGLSPLVLQSRTFVFLVFGWLAFVSFGAPEASTLLRRLLVTFLVCLNTSLLLLLPKSRQQFTSLLALCVIIVLSMCYLGVLLIPSRAVHQATDLVEPALAGDWRGVFEHKNTAAPAMIIMFFFSLYLGSSFSRRLGWLLALLSFIFLWQANGKTALGLLPLSLLITWLLSRRPKLGVALMVTFILGFNTLTVGSAFVPAIHDFVDSLGIDATFTSRADIWNLAVTAIIERPLTGYGFHAFWQSEWLLHSEYAKQTWAVTAGHAHNAYIDAMIDGGIPALVLTVIWLVLLPLRDVSAAWQRGADRPLTLLYTRIWVFSLVIACMESSFFTSNSVLWFSLLIAVFGLHLQVHANLVDEPARRKLP